MRKFFETPEKGPLFGRFQAKFANLKKIKVVLDATYIAETTL